MTISHLLYIWQSYSIPMSFILRYLTSTRNAKAKWRNYLFKRQSWAGLYSTILRSCSWGNVHCSSSIQSKYWAELCRTIHESYFMKKWAFHILSKKSWAELFSSIHRPYMYFWKRTISGHLTSHCLSHLPYKS